MQATDSAYAHAVYRIYASQAKDENEKRCKDALEYDVERSAHNEKQNFCQRPMSGLERK